MLIPGTGVPGSLARLVYGLLCGATNAQIMQDIWCGWDNLAASRQRYLPRLEQHVRKHGRVVLIGQSQGGRQAIELGCRYPELFRGVVAVSAPLGAISPLPLIPRPLVRFAGQFLPAVHDMACNQDLSAQLQQEVAAGWSPDVSVRLIAVAGDYYVRPRRAALDLDFPAGTDVHKYFLSPWRPRDLPADVHHLASWLALGHISEMINGTVHRIAAEGCRPLAAAA